MACGGLCPHPGCYKGRFVVSLCTTQPARTLGSEPGPHALGRAGPAWAQRCSLSAHPPPPPRRAGKSSSRRRSSDIISLLVSIYGSKDLFINEYRSLLADRLLHQFSFSPER